MKITPEDYAKLEAAVKPLDTPERRAQYKHHKISAKRYRWDLLYCSKIKIGDGVGVKGDIDLYAYLNDDHIDTALKRIVCYEYNM